MKVFVTSNQQFGRPGAIKAYNRPFKNVQEMNAVLISKWNSAVSDGDVIFVLGNFAWDPEVAEELIKSLNGDIFVIDGEWDRPTSDLVKIKGDVGVKTGKIRYVSDGIKVLGNVKSVLSYWPMTDWPRKKKGYISFIGHPNKKYKSDHKNKVVNVSCDAWDYKPIEMKNIVTLYNDPDLKK